MSGMERTYDSWYSPRLECDVGLARWGHWGQPVLLFPTAGGDAFEIERMGLIEAVRPLIEGGRVKVYSCDSVAGVALAEKSGSAEHRCWLLRQFGEYVAHEVVPAIHTDCDGEPVEIVTAGASIGAFNAIGALCRYPRLFRAAIGMSGTYELQRLLGLGPDNVANEDYHLAAHVRFLPFHPDDEVLACLRTRFAVLAHGRGRWEDPEESWRMADALGARGVPNRVDPWGIEHDHDWATWHEMLPRYLDELCA